MKLALASAIGLAAALAVVPAPGQRSAVIAATAAPSSKITGGCFRSHDIRNHTVGDNRTLYLDVPPRGIYRVTMRGSCLAGAVNSDPLVMQSPPGRELICRPIDLDISVSKGGFPSPCIVDTITALTPEEAAALPSKLRP